MPTGAVCRAVRGRSCRPVKSGAAEWRRRLRREGGVSSGAPGRELRGHGVPRKAAETAGGQGCSRRAGSQRQRLTAEPARAAAPRIAWRVRRATARGRGSISSFGSCARRSCAEGPRGRAVPKEPHGAPPVATPSPGRAVPVSFPRELPRRSPRYAVVVAVPDRYTRKTQPQAPAVSAGHRGDPRPRGARTATPRQAPRVRSVS